MVLPYHFYTIYSISRGCTDLISNPICSLYIFIHYFTKNVQFLCVWQISNFVSWNGVVISSKLLLFKNHLLVLKLTYVLRLTFLDQMTKEKALKKRCAKTSQILDYRSKEWTDSIEFVWLSWIWPLFAYSIILSYYSLPSFRNAESQTSYLSPRISFYYY